MSMPYKVSVRNVNGEISINVTPPPVSVNEQYTEEITLRIQSIIVAPRQNTMFHRARLKDELTSALKHFHEREMIVPKGLGETSDTPLDS